MRTGGSERLEWEIEVPLLTNRHVVGGLAKAMLGGGVLVLLLVMVPLVAQADWRAVSGIAALLLAVSCGLFAVALLVMAYPFRNRLRTRFVIDTDAVHMSTTDAIARGASGAAIFAGLALGSAAATGSGLLAAVQESQSLRWRGGFRACVEPSTRSIALRNGWRTLLRVYCLPENFDAAIALIAAHSAVNGTASRAAAHSPVPGYLARTALTVGASFPLLALSGPLRTGLLPPFLLMCFALATVWLVRPLAWVALALIGANVVLLLAGGLAPRTSTITGSRYHRFESLPGDDWALIALAAAGLAWLGWFAIATLRGRIQPALSADLSDTGDEDA